MFESHSLFAFFLLAMVTTLSPGPAVVLAISNGATLGLRRSLVGILGNAVALICYASLASLGLGTLISAGGVFLLHTIQCLGGGYLCYLGYQSIRSAKKIAICTEVSTSASTKAGTVFVKAALVGLSNPKAIVFFSALFPQFIHIENHIVLQSLLLTLIFVSCSVSVLTFYAYFSSRFFVGRHVSWFHLIHKVAGYFFILFGGTLAISAFKD